MAPLWLPLPESLGEDIQAASTPSPAPRWCVGERTHVPHTRAHAHVSTHLHRRALTRALARAHLHHSLERVTCFLDHDTSEVGGKPLFPGPSCAFRDGQRVGLGVPGSVRWGPPAQGTHSWHPSAREVLGSSTQALSCGRRSGRRWRSGSRTLALPAVEGIGAVSAPRCLLRPGLDIEVWINRVHLVPGGHSRRQTGSSLLSPSARVTCV